MKKMEKLREVNKLIDNIINDLETRLFIKDYYVNYKKNK